MFVHATKTSWFVTYLKLPHINEGIEGFYFNSIIFFVKGLFGCKQILLYLAPIPSHNRRHTIQYNNTQLGDIKNDNTQGNNTYSTLSMAPSIMKNYHNDTQHYDTQLIGIFHNDIKHNSTQLNDTQHIDTQQST